MVCMRLYCYVTPLHAYDFVIKKGVISAGPCIFWSEIPGSKSRSIFNFWSISILPSIVAAPVCIPTKSQKGFPFLHVLASACCLLIYWWWPFWQVWEGISLWFLFTFLRWLVTLNIFSYWPPVCPLWRSLCSSHLPIF